MVILMDKPCKRGNLKCSLGFETKNKRIEDKYTSDYICDPNQHGWMAFIDPNLIETQDYIKKCSNSNNPEQENGIVTPEKKNNYGYTYKMSNKGIVNNIRFHTPQSRNKCIVCKKQKYSYNELQNNIAKKKENKKKKSLEKQKLLTHKKENNKKRNLEKKKKLSQKKENKKS
jgi:hypothetical protein